VVVIVRCTHPDKVALHRGTRIPQHAAKFSAVVQDEEVDVELPRRTLVVGDLAGAVRVDNGLPSSTAGTTTVETLRSVTFEKTIRIADTGPQQ
jgi:predicted component of type VI protein secretion system